MGDGITASVDGPSTAKIFHAQAISENDHSMSKNAQEQTSAMSTFRRPKYEDNLNPESRSESLQTDMQTTLQRINQELLLENSEHLAENRILKSNNNELELQKERMQTIIRQMRVEAEAQAHGIKNQDVDKCAPDLSNDTAVGFGTSFRNNVDNMPNMENAQGTVQGIRGILVDGVSAQAAGDGGVGNSAATHELPYSANSRSTNEEDMRKSILTVEVENNKLKEERSVLRQDRATLMELNNKFRRDLRRLSNNAQFSAETHYEAERRIRNEYESKIYSIERTLNDLSSQNDFLRDALEKGTGADRDRVYTAEGDANKVFFSAQETVLIPRPQKRTPRAASNSSHVSRSPTSREKGHFYQTATQPGDKLRALQKKREQQRLNTSAVQKLKVRNWNQIDDSHSAPHE